MMISGKAAFKKALEFSDRARNEIELEIKKSKKVQSKVKGPRAIFIEKYNESENLDEAKKALVDACFKIETFNDEILKKWIEEERNNDGR